MTPQSNQTEQFRAAARIYQLTGEFVAPIVLGLIVDLLAKTMPWGTAIGVVLALLIGGLRVAQLAAKIGPPPKAPPDPNKPPGTP